MEKVLKDPRDMVSLTNRRSEDFTEPVVSCMALRTGVGGLPIVVCADTSGLCVVYDGATSDLMGKLSPYVISGHAHDIPTEGFAAPLSAAQAFNLCKRASPNDGAEGMIPSASQESLIDVEAFDVVRAAARKKCMISCGGDCVIIVAGNNELLEWNPLPEEGNANEVDSESGGATTTMKSVPSSSVLSDADNSSMPPASLAIFAIGDVITSLCPGIAASCGGEDVDAFGSPQSRSLAVSLFPRLTPGQRKDPTLELSAAMLGLKSRGGGTASLGGSGARLMSRQTTAESKIHASTQGGGSRAVSRARTSTAGSKKSLMSNEGRSVASGLSGNMSDTGGVGGALTAENLAAMLGSRPPKVKGGGGAGMVWGSDPAGRIVGIVKSKKGKKEGEEREARMKKRREELLSLLS